MLNVVKIQKVAHWLYLHHIPLFPKLLQLLIFICYSSSISYKTNIGKGTFFNHAGFGILINSKVQIGDDCKIGNNVSIIGQSPYKNPPILKNHIFVGPGAIIQGPVIVEDNVIVAPNAVVTKSVPMNAIVAGIPAKIVGWTDKLDYDIFKDEAWKEETKPYIEV